MKRISLFILLSLFGFVAFASFPVDTLELIVSDPEAEKFKLDTVAFIIGILTFWLMFLFGLPLLLLLINKKNFRGSLAWGWLVGLLLPFVIALLILAGSGLEDFKLLY
tara:strand:+ start:5881 stop:6204 length:324 start_codon:yes stop_codon:yes gene_type:complete